MVTEKKKVAVLVEDMFNVFEFWYPYYRLQEAGYQVVVLGTGRKSVFTGKPATEVTADMAIEEARVDEYAGVVIPGGYAPDMMRRSPAMVQFVADMDRAGKTVAAICHAGWVLVSAKILEGRKATSFFAIKDDLVNAGAAWVDEPVVVDGNLVTSRVPDDLPLFMPAVLRGLAG